MEEVNRIRKLYHLKNVERTTSVGSRKESTAEHTWSSMILADYFLSKMNDTTLDKTKVYELLMYHDLVEIECGDVCVSKVEERKNKKEIEMKAMHTLKDQIPSALKEKFVALFTEFEEQKTKKARFAKAVEQLDAELHEMDYKEDWKGWTEEFLRSAKEHYFEEFPALKEIFEKTTTYARENGYFDQ